ncbi:unnamed protein product [Brassica rapa subsp. trilocularis]
MYIISLKLIVGSGERLVVQMVASTCQVSTKQHCCLSFRLLV